MEEDDVYDSWGYTHEPYEEDNPHMYYDVDYMLDECRECGVTTYGSDICPDCWAVEKAMDQQEMVTKAEKREAQRNKGQYGPVRHIDPNLRPKKMEKPRINVRGKFKRGK